jgi:phospholipid/cholesterol/gamma-HCH transport system substrate-binding protein
LSTSTAVGRIAAILALIGAFVVVLLLVFGGGSSYSVTANFENASQLVKGNTVAVAGVSVGKVNKIKLADDGQAEVVMSIDDPAYEPLKTGTIATVRSQSVSGVANRYVELQMPPADQAGADIKSGGVIDQTDTVSEVDLDSLFNTLNKPTINGLKGVIKGFAQAYSGVGPETNQGFHYLNPFLSTSRRVFGELNRDQPALESLIVDGASLTSALAARSADLNRIVDGGSKALGAIGRQNQALASAVGQLPDFMRQFDTTAFNLRAALDDVDPVVNASKPVAKKLLPFTKNLRGFAKEAVPTITNLDSIVRAPGPNNDLIELTNLQVPLGQIASGPVDRNGASREGALPASANALSSGLPQLSFLRPYLTLNGVSGWFDDFGHSGIYDANGGIGRIGTTFNTFSASTPGIPDLNLLGLQSGTDFINNLKAIGGLGNLQRCPGALERSPSGGTPSNAQLLSGLQPTDCNTSQVPIGP